MAHKKGRRGFSWTSFSEKFTFSLFSPARTETTGSEMNCPDYGMLAQKCDYRFFDLSRNCFLFNIHSYLAFGLYFFCIFPFRAAHVVYAVFALSAFLCDKVIYLVSHSDLDSAMYILCMRIWAKCRRYKQFRSGSIYVIWLRRLRIRAYKEWTNYVWFVWEFRCIFNYPMLNL